MSLLGLFCQVDDFCQAFLTPWQTQLLANRLRQRQRDRRLSPSEIMTILLHFHQSHYRDFKAFYTRHVRIHLRSEFPGLDSYSRLVEFIPSVLLPLCAYLRYCRVFARLAARRKTSTGWFFGFKVHLVCNDKGELLECVLTPGNVDDRRPVPQMVQRLFGKI